MMYGRSREKCQLTKTTTKYRESVIAVMVLVIVVADMTGGSSDFYYNNWQCNNYLSAESVVIQAPSGHLLEVHIRDDIPVSLHRFCFFLF